MVLDGGIEEIINIIEAGYQGPRSVIKLKSILFYKAHDNDSLYIRIVSRQQPIPPALFYFQLPRDFQCAQHAHRSFTFLPLSENTTCTQVIHVFTLVQEHKLQTSHSYFHPFLRRQDA